MNASVMLPRELEDRVRQELESGEHILWMDQPVPRYFTLACSVLFLFAMPWTAFAVFWICGAAEFKMPDFSKGGVELFPLFGVPFVLVGLGMMSAPWWTYRKSLKTVYAITDRRAIVFEAGWSFTIRSFPPDQLRNLHRKERPSGLGDVVLGQQIVQGSRNGVQTQEIGFLNIRNPKDVERMVRALAGRDGGE